MNPIPYAIAISIVLLSAGVFLQARRMKDVKLGVSGIHATLNGHPTDESIGKMLYETRDSVERVRDNLLDHASRPANEAHATQRPA